MAQKDHICLLGLLCEVLGKKVDTFSALGGPMTLCVCCRSEICSYLLRQSSCNFGKLMVWCGLPFWVSLGNFFDSVEDESQLCNTWILLGVHNPSQLTLCLLFPFATKLRYCHLWNSSETATVMHLWPGEQLSNTHELKFSLHYAYPFVCLQVMIFWQPLIYQECISVKQALTSSPNNSSQSLLMDYLFKASLKSLQVDLFTALTRRRNQQRPRRQEKKQSNIKQNNGNQ